MGVRERVVLSVQPTARDGGGAPFNNAASLGGGGGSRQWLGGPVQALRRLPGLGPDGKSGPTQVAAAATPHGGSVAHKAAQHRRGGKCI